MGARGRNGTPLMSVEKTRAEILRLIAKVHGTDAAAPRGSAAAATARAAVEGTLRARRAELDRLKQQREYFAAKLSRTPLVDRVAQLERRLAEIEGRGAGDGKPATLPTAPGAAVPSDAVFGGMIRETMLGDMLQLVTSQAMSGVFTVTDGAQQVLMYFYEGQIHHATAGQIEGEDAVFAAMTIQKGAYYFRETAQLPEQRTISANTQFLILEALRRIDEQGAGGDE